MNNTQALERATVDAFVRLHNDIYGTQFSFHERSDAPDAVCKSGPDSFFGVEVTITEDRSGDLRWILGRSDSREPQEPPVSCLQQSVFEQLSKRLKSKALMRYGSVTALVIRDSSGVDWDWEAIAPQVREFLGRHGNPFSMGIWIVNRAATRLQKLA